jgi:hypothetical protein
VLESPTPYKAGSGSEPHCTVGTDELFGMVFHVNVPIDLSRTHAGPAHSLARGHLPVPLCPALLESLPCISTYPSQPPHKAGV